MPLKRPQRSRCPMCQGELELRDNQLVCLHCLVIWHGDTFEPIPWRRAGLDPLDELYQ